MASWLQAQLKAAENLLEAVDRTVSATTVVPGAPNSGRDPGGTNEYQSAEISHQQSGSNAGATQQGQHGMLQHGSSGGPMLAANVSKGLAWLQGSPKPGGSPSQGSPSHPAAAAAASSQKEQPPQMWQPYKPQSFSSGSKLNAQGSMSPAPSSPARSRAVAAALTLASSTGGFTSRTQGPFSSGSSSSSSTTLSPSNNSSSKPAPHQPRVGQAAYAVDQSESFPKAPVGLLDEAVNGDSPLVASALPAGASVAAAQDPGQTDLAQPGSVLPTAALPDVSSAVSTKQLLQPIASTADGADAQPQVSEAAACLEPAAVAAGVAAGTSADAAPEVASSIGLHSSPDAQQEQLEPVTITGPAAADQQHWLPAASAAADHPASTAAEAASAGVSGSTGSTAGTSPDPAAAPASGFTSAEGSADGAAAGSSSLAAAGAAAGGAGAVAPAKEAQLTRLVETLRKRLEVVRGENQQLEDMLHEAEQRSSAEQARMASLTAELTALQRDQEGLVSSAAANAAAQDAHIGRLQAELESSSRQVAALQAELQAVQEQHAQALSSKDSMEGGALEALRAEVAAYEGQLEAERKAHAATKAATTNRERDLEEQLGSSSEALAATQRMLEEASSRTREAEEQQLLAAAEAARLQQQVVQLTQQQSGTDLKDSHLQLQLEAEREAEQRRVAEAESQAVAALQAQRAAEARVAELQAEVSHLHSSYQAQAASRGAPQLEQQLRELQELLYQKQQQLERLSGEKQAQQLMLERQITSLKSELGKAHAAAAAAVTGVSLRSGHDIIPMDALGEPYQRLARHNKLGGAVQATARFLDTTAASTSQLLRQQPLARLIVFLYIVLIHLYVYFLLARMQKQALLLVSQQDKMTGIGPEHMVMQAPPAPALSPPFPPPAAAVGHP